MARNDALDTARAIAMVFVVTGHAVVSFMVTPVGWAVQDRSQWLGVDLYAWIVRAFAMPTFFWLSGYFSCAVLDVGGLRGYLRHRVVRILIPLVLALVPCSVVLSWLWDWGREVAMRSAVADNIPKLQRSELPIMLGHLWYLYYVLWLSVGALVVARVARAVRLHVSSGPGVLAVPALITFGTLAWLRSLHTDTPLGFIPDVSIALYMGGYFAWGWLVRGRPEDLPRYGGYAWRALSIAPLPLAIVIATLYRGLEAIEPVPAYASAASALFSMCMIVGFLGLCVRYGRPYRWLRLASESSYWFYIAHLPIVVALQILLAPVAVPGILKFVGIVVVTSALCMASYALVSRVMGASRARS
jgi:peptidoglycan/LPS O-acetylase OafA/YrhL